MLVVSVAGLAVAARAFRHPLYFEHVNLIPFNTQPAAAIARALVLLYQPGYLNILPLYMLLLAWLPVVVGLLRVHMALAIAVSAAVWTGAGLMQVNLPSYPDDYGWVFNPFSWQLLFTLGAASAQLARTGDRAPLRAPFLFWAAVAYVLFALLVAAPWTSIPGLHDLRVLRDFRVDLSKQYLSAWRLAHILALAYLAASLISMHAGWLGRLWARALIECGRHSLPVFCLSIVLSLTGFVVLVEAGRSLQVQIAVNVVGVTLLGLTAWNLARMQRRKGRGQSVWGWAKASGWLPSRL